MLIMPYSSSKHSGVLSYFNRRFIKGELLSEELGRAINKAFDLRQRADYREQVTLTREQVAPFLNSTREFIDSVSAYLRENGHI